MHMDTDARAKTFDLASQPTCPKSALLGIY